MKGQSVQTRTLVVGLALTICVPIALTCKMAWAVGPGSWLITPKEAAMAPAAPDVLERGRKFDVGREGLEAGPFIEVIKPASDQVVAVPVEVLVVFTTKGAPIDFQTLKVSVVKFFSFDITDRILPYATPAGIHIPDAKLPSGEHTVRIGVADTDGAFSRKQLTLRVP